MQRNQSGQILLITLLVLTVATTVALSLIGRSTIDLSISNQLEESTRAFNAAEAGIEQALRSGVGTAEPQVLTPGVSYDVAVSQIGGSNGVYQLPHETVEGATETIWLVDHTSDGDIIENPFYTGSTIDVCWSRPTGADPAAALVVSVLYKESTDSTYKTARVAIDPLAASRSNYFDGTGITDPNGCGLSYYRKTINFTSLSISPASDTLLALRVRPEYSDTTIALQPTGVSTLPRQGSQIDSVGTTTSGISRKVIVYQMYRTPASIFDYTIYSQSLFGH